MSAKIEEVTREELADLSAEDLEKLKKDLDDDTKEDSLDGVDSKDDIDGDSQDKGEDEDEEGDELPDDKDSDSEKRLTEDDPEDEEVDLTDPENRKEYIDQFLSAVENNQDLSKYDIKELQKIVHVQNKRLNDKDEFIETLKIEKREERAKNREQLKKLEKDYREKKEKRLSEDELSERYHDDPLGTQKIIKQYETEDQSDERELQDAYLRDKILTNKERMLGIDKYSPYEFEALLPEMKLYLKSMGQFKDSDIDTFASKPYEEDFEVLLDLRNKAIEAMEKKGKKSIKNKEAKEDKNDQDNEKINERKKEDIAQKINKAKRRTTPIRGTGNESNDNDIARSLRQLGSGRVDLSSLSREELDKLKRQTKDD